MSAAGKLAEIYPAHVENRSIHGQGYFTLYIDIDSFQLSENFFEQRPALAHSLPPSRNSDTADCVESCESVCDGICRPCGHNT